MAFTYESAESGAKMHVGRCGGWLVPDGGCTCWDKALAVARAYLGDPGA